MLCAKNLWVYRNGQAALAGVSVQLAPGEIVGVLGPNGAGKSTLLAALSGELEAGRGEVSLDGRLLSSWGGAARARRLAVLPQSSSLSFAFSVAQVVGMGRLPHATGQDHDTLVIEQALRAADAWHLLERNYTQLSGGERQRVHLARVLAQLWPGEAGQCLLLDEPTSMLDPLHQHSVLGAVRRFAERGAAVLLIVHDLNLAARYCDRLMLLEAGSERALGTPDQVLQPEPLKAVFGLDVLVQRHPERGHPLVISR